VLPLPVRASSNEDGAAPTVVSLKDRVSAADMLGASAIASVNTRKKCGRMTCGNDAAITLLLAAMPSRLEQSLDA
jgi:hypothetical protein